MLTKFLRSKLVLLLWVLSLLSGTSGAAQTPEEADAESSAVAHASAPLTRTEAEDALLHGDYDKAREGFAQLTEQLSTRIPATLGLARVELATGEYERALKRLRALRAPRSSDRLLLIARLTRLLGDYDEALTSAGRAVALDGDDARARYAQAELLEYLGRRDAAIAAYRWFDEQMVTRGALPRDAGWLTAAARGFLRYSVLTRTNLRRRTQHALHEMLQVAYGVVDRTYTPARIVAADLLRERYNNDESDGSVSDYRAALGVNEHLPEAHVGLGEVALTNWGFEEVEKRTDKALSVNARFVPALHLSARKLIVERRYRQAIEVIERALAINPKDLEALGIKAAAHACLFADDHVEALLDEIATINPRCASAYAMLGDALGGIRQYEASETAYLKAIEYEPTDANARTELGMMYMQWGREDKARDALDAAWALDPYNERTKFTLELLKQLEQFARVETEHFIIAYDEQRDPGLGPYIASYLEDMYEEVTGDYDMEPAHKTVIEMFPTHRAFGVRITGRPWIHTVGACTGRVIAMETPRDSIDLMGPYNLAHVLKHEFTHTVTLAATRNRIPHWFTEGLAVYQEDTPRSFEWATLLAEAARRDELFTLESIDWGFMRPRRRTDRSMAYAQSEWMVEYIVGRFGYDVIGRMLEQYRAGRTQPEVLRGVLGVAPEAFDAAFREWARSEVRSWGFSLAPPEDVDEVRALVEADPKNADLLARLARAHFDAEEYEPAYETARQALSIDENQVIALGVFVELAAAFAEQERDADIRRAYEQDALPALDRLLELDPDHWAALRARAKLALRRDNLKLAETLLRRLQRACPMDPASWRGLAGILLKRGEDEKALPQLLELARLDGNDHGIRAELGRIYRRRERLHDARYWYRQALAIDPFNVAYHETLGDVSMQAGDARTALREYRMLTKLEPRTARHFAQAAFAANRLGDEEATRQFAKRAVALDPKSPARGLLD